MVIFIALLAVTCEGVLGFVFQLSSVVVALRAVCIGIVIVQSGKAISIWTLVFGGRVICPF